jgi:hypothetical protein
MCNIPQIWVLTHANLNSLRGGLEIVQFVFATWRDIAWFCTSSCNFFTKHDINQNSASYTMWETTFPRNSQAGLGRPFYEPNQPSATRPLFERISISDIYRKIKTWIRGWHNNGLKWRFVQRMGRLAVWRTKKVALSALGEILLRNVVKKVDNAKITS